MNKIKASYEVGGDWEIVTLTNYEINEKYVVENHHVDIAEVLKVLQDWGCLDFTKSFLEEDDDWLYDENVDYDREAEYEED